MRTRLTAACVLVLVALVPAAARQTASAVIEPRTGITFAASLIPPGSTAELRLAGAAVRDRTIFHVHIYAYGLYLDAAGARAALAAFARVPAATLARDERFANRLLEMDVAMALRIVMARDVDGDAIADAFDSALRPRVAQAALRNMPGGAQALETFRGYFDLKKIAKGQEIIFSCAPGGHLETSVNRAARPPIDSRALCWALFDVYLGSKPISSDGKARLLGGVADLVAGSLPSAR